MTNTILGRIDGDDLARYRMADVRIDTARIMPGAYGRTEIEEAFIRWYQLRQEFQEKYGLPEHANWTIQLTNGVVIEDG